MKRLLPALLVPLLFALSASSAAASKTDDAIEARKAFMQMLQFNMGLLGAMARGSTPYDAEQAAAAAGNIYLAARMNNSAMWPDGSDNQSHSATKARPALWQDHNQALSAQQAWLTAAEAMVEHAGNGQQALRGQILALSDSCKGCHRSFKAR